MKKKMFMLIILMLTMMYIPNVFAADITACNNVLPNVTIDSKIPDTVHMIIVVIQIATPVLLVVFGMMDLVKGIMAGKEDEIKKGQQTFVKRLIAAAIVFFVIVIVKFIISAVADSNDKQGIMDCANCFLNGTKGGSCSK